MTNREKIAARCYLVPALVLLAFGLRYLFAAEFMPYHEAGNGRFEERLRRSGFDRVEHFGPEECEALFFSERADGLEAPSFERIVVGGTRVAG